MATGVTEYHILAWCKSALATNHITASRKNTWLILRILTFENKELPRRPSAPQKRIPANTERIPPEYHPKGGANTTQKEE